MRPAGSEVSTWPVPDEVNVERRDASLDARPRRDHDVNASQAQEAAVRFAARARADQSDIGKPSYSVVYVQLQSDTHAGATCGNMSLTGEVTHRQTASFPAYRPRSVTSCLDAVTKQFVQREHNAIRSASNQ